jgi:AcrR family transcriptional regulator
MQMREGVEMTAKARMKPRRIGPGRLSAEDAAQLVDRLLDAAWALFSKDGYDRTTMEAIAREAGASTKTLYSRYSDKGEVLQAVVRRIVERITAARATEGVANARGVDPRQFLVGLGREVATAISENAAGLNRIAFSEARHFPELAAMYNAAVGNGVGIIRSALEQWRKDGLLPSLTDPDRAAVLCLSMMTDQARIRSAIGQPMSRSEVNAHVNYAAGLFLKACGYR